ncbi:hypothetical protein IGB42_01706 [Andreprevotia sp. IGB-42]|nr:hypothetical protein IGB42_01706 [Andreprevotia sp. IGB-42]
MIATHDNLPAARTACAPGRTIAPWRFVIEERT